MKKPNDLARQVMAKAADHHAKLADQYEQLADIARRYAIALREGNAEFLLTAANELDGLDIVSTKKAAMNELSLLATADPEFMQDLADENRKRRVATLDQEGILMELLLHSMQCKDPHNCAYHRALEDRARQIR